MQAVLVVLVVLTIYLPWFVLCCVIFAGFVYGVKVGIEELKYTSAEQIRSGIVSMIREGALYILTCGIHPFVVELIRIRRDREIKNKEKS